MDRRHNSLTRNCINNVNPNLLPLKCFPGIFPASTLVARDAVYTKRNIQALSRVLAKALFRLDLNTKRGFMMSLKGGF